MLFLALVSTFLLSVGAQDVTTEAPIVIFQCPFNETADTCVDGNFADPEDCESFYQCSNCIPYRQTCPDGLHFNPRIDRCVEPRDANCRVSVFPTGSTTPGTPGTTLAPGTYSGFGFSVARSQDLAAPATPVSFNRVLCNVGGAYEESKAEFRSRGSAYFVSLSVGARTGSGIGYKCAVNTIPQFSATRRSRIHEGPDTITRDMIWAPANNDIMNIVSDSALYSDNELQTSWTLFDVANVSSNVYFSVARSTQLESQGPLETVVFPTIVTNVGGGWQQSSNEFKAPQDGVYFFSISTGVVNNRQVNFNLRKNGEKFVDLYRQGTNHDGSDTMGRSIMTQLSAGDVMRITMDSGTWSESDNELQTSFSGFLYQPDHGSRFAWSVGRTSSWSSDTEFLYPVPFNQVLVNEGSVFDATSSKIRITVSGLYFIHISAGALANTAVNYSLLKNEDEIVCDIFRRSEAHNGDDSLGRSIMVDLRAGDEIALGAGRGTGLYSDAELQTSFSGFLAFRDLS